jgi:peptide/nickel transport system ATP-binding protein
VTPLLEVKDLRCSFRGQAREGARKSILDGISFSVAARSCLGLIGDSGSGKSTIARCIAGLENPDAGTISLMGKNVFPNSENRKEFRGMIQMLYQDHSASLDPLMTIQESLAEGVRARTGEKKVEERVIFRLLEEVGLESDVCVKYPRQLSGGERQRIALARSLAVKPALLVLDEPTSALDTVSQLQIIDLIKAAQVANNTAILFISHDIASLVSICDHIAVLYEGRIVEHGETARVLANPSHQYTKRIAALNP